MPYRQRIPGSFWPNEEQLLLLRAALSPGERGVAAFRDWRSRVDGDDHFSWNVIRLLPLVYHNLHLQGIRDPLMARLKGLYRRAWYETHRLFHRSAPAVASLVAHGCDVLLLKGAPLALSYYRNHALRPMADLDVAVRRHQVDHAIRLLEELGFRSTIPVSADLFRFRHALQFVHPDGGELDLHWHVLFEAGHAGADASFWAAAERLDFMGTSVNQLDPTCTLLHTILHGVRWNEETSIRWIPDALTILRSPDHAVDWERLAALARAHKLTSRLQLGLSYLSENFEAPIPATALTAVRVRPSLVERVENTVMLADGTRYARSALGAQWMGFTEYCRYAEPGGGLAFLRGYSEYLRFIWGLDGRRQILPFILRGMGRRLQRGGRAGGALLQRRISDG